MDLRQIYLSIAALSGLVSFKSLLHTAFTVRPDGLFLTFVLSFSCSEKALHTNTLSVSQLFGKEGSGSLSAEDLSDLMGALLGVPQHNAAELYRQASNQGQLTEGECQLCCIS